uniref:Uncharacterized protein n=1 Tax=Kalanchoe fedtschenkoi TaxID=63787 RepID=A0A7N0R846_KALFE
MSTLSMPGSLVHSASIPTRRASGCSLKRVDQHLGSVASANLSYSSKNGSSLQLTTCRRSLAIHSSYSEGRSRGTGAGIFVGAFLLGGIVAGALSCIYAPQISHALAGADKEDLIRKLPKFIYDEDKALEKKRKVLADKIAQLNSAIDDVSSQLRADDEPNGSAVYLQESEADV